MIKNKVLFLLSVIFILFMTGCVDALSNVSDTSNSGTSDNKSTHEDKTYLKIENKSQFDINVFFNSPYGDPFATVKSNGSETKEISASQTKSGDSICIQYLYKIGDITIPYYKATDNACFQIKQIIEKTENIITVQKLQSLQINSNFLILKNEKNIDIALYNSSNEPVYPLNNENYWILSNEFQIYEFKSMNSIEGYKIGNGLYNQEIEIKETEGNNIYTISYSDSGIDLISIVPIDIATQSKIWRMSVSQTLGQSIKPDFFIPRENPRDGYLLGGQLKYSPLLDDERSTHYVAKISENGVVDDYIIPFKEASKSTCSTVAIEKDGKLIVGGYKITTDDKIVSFFYGDSKCNFYYEPTQSSLGIPVALHHIKGNTFACLFENKTSGFSILQFDVTESSIINETVIYSNDGNHVPFAFIYANEHYFVVTNQLIDDNNTRKASIFSISKNGDNEIEFFSQEKTVVQSIVYNGDNAFIGGAIEDPKTGIFTAFFSTIDIESNTVVETKLFPSKKVNSLSWFNTITINDNKIICAGLSEATGYNVNTGYIQDENYFPFLVVYDLKLEKTIQNIIYSDLSYKGYEISECYVSGIGTPLIVLTDFWETEHFIASCGLLGEIVENENEITLPVSSEIPILPAPKMVLKFHDFEDNAFTFEFNYEEIVSVEDVKNCFETIKDSYVFEEGKTVADWIMKFGGEEKNLSQLESIKFYTDYNLYPIFRIACPTNLDCSLKSASPISLIVSWNANPIADSYQLCWSRDSSFSQRARFAGRIPRVCTYQELNNNSLSYVVNGIRTSSDSETRSNLVQETMYYFSIRAYDSEKDEWSDWSENMSVQYRPRSTNGLVIPAHLEVNGRMKQ